MDEIILSMEVLRNQQKKPWKKKRDLMMTKHPSVPGCCMHIDNQACAVHVIVCGTNTCIFVIIFPTPYPNILLFFTVCDINFAHDIANIWYIPAIFFCTVLGIVNNMHTSFDGITVILPSHGPSRENMCQIFDKNASVWFVLIGEKVI